MKNKTLIWSIAVILLLVIIALVYLVYFNTSEVNPEISGIKLSEDKLITNQTLIDMIVNKRISPLGNMVTMRIIRDDYSERGIMDGVYEVVYYSCPEHRGWIYYSVGESSIKSSLYGPYEYEGCYV